MKFLKQPRTKGIRNIILVVLIIFSMTNIGKSFWLSLEDALGVSDRNTIADEKALSITFFDVGKADCILIESDFCNVLIDGATDYYSDDILSYLNKRNIDCLDAIFISHFDADHYTGLTEVLKNIDIKVIYTGWDDNFPYDSWFEELIVENNITVKQLYYSDIINFDEINFEILSPQKEYDGSNEMSLVSKLTYKDFSVLFTGDVENDALDDLCLLGEKLNVNVLQLPHHGSANGVNEEFLNATKPNLTVISTGAYASFLPSYYAINLLNEFGLEFYQTYNDDNIIIATNADSKMTISTKEKTYETTYN